MRAPFPPLTLLRLVKLWPHARRQHREKGQLYRVGYYCRHCGPEVVWLVDSAGNYNWTADRAFIDRYFEVVESSRERSLDGRRKPKLGPLKPTQE